MTEQSINSKEIRIGNKLKKGGTVVTVDAQTIVKIDDIGDAAGYTAIDLTPEWLERSGFERKTLARHELRLPFNGYYPEILGLCIGSGGRYIDFSTQVTPRPGKEFTDKISVGNPIKYVHQLQNLFFCLCGTELEFKL